MNFNQSGFKIDLENKRLILSNTSSIPIKIHREIDGEIKGVIVKRNPSGKWYVLFQVEENGKEPLPITGKSVGIDVGVRYFLTDSDRRQIENQKFYEKTLSRIKNIAYSMRKK